ncbi:MAG: zf-HC2 domain-containing protein [Thermodesulfobacteriota bacterium]|jgi:hypothetical protein
MECEKVRDQYSSLLERELNPLEERTIREHLASCPECQRELEQFDKMLCWLHCADQVEVPEGFLSEILEKLEDRKKKGPMSEKGSWRRFDKALSWKLPIQAMAMVAIVLLAIYITKMVPIQTPSVTKNVEQSKPPRSEVFRSEWKKLEPKVASKEVNQEKVFEQIPPEGERLKQIEEDKRIVSEERKEEKKWDQLMVSKAQPSEPELVGKTTDTKEKVPLDAKPIQEIVMKVTDRGKILSQLNELVRQFGGEIITSERNTLLASLPDFALSEFEKDVARLGSLEKRDQFLPRKSALGGSSVEPGMRRREIEEKGEAPASPMPRKEGRIVVRIVLRED